MVQSRNPRISWKFAGRRALLVILASGICLLQYPGQSFGVSFSPFPVQDETPQKSDPSSTTTPSGAADTDAPPASQETDNTILGVDLNAINEFASRMRSARQHSRLSPEIVDLMKPVIASASSSTVRVYSDKEQLSIGTVIGADGFILTVADELKTPIQCRLPDGTTRSATVFGVDQETGLALLKIEANNLNPLSLGDFAEPTLGNWLASVSPDKNPIAIGIVSVLERKISGGGAFIGITMDNDSKGVRILSVVADSPADVSDLFINDIIIKIDGKSVATREELITQMQNYSAGDEVELVVLRQGQEKTFQLVLAPRNKFDQDRSQQDRMGSKLSKRRQGFSLAFQHDSFLQGNECGSPVLDLDGKLIGINISRSGRVSSLALPMSVVLPAIERLKSGQLAPAIINARRIELIQSELDSIAKDLAPLPESLNQFNQNLIQEEAKIEEVKNSQRILEERLKELSEASEKSKKEVEQIQSKITDFERRRARLLKELDELKVGAQ